MSGECKSLENIVEEIRLSPGWSAYFREFHDPYLHLTKNGFRILRIHTEAKAWDFKSREAFLAFCAVGCVEWTRRLPAAERPAFINDVLDRYQAIAADRPGEENTFKFY